MIVMRGMSFQNWFSQTFTEDGNQVICHFERSWGFVDKFMQKKELRMYLPIKAKISSFFQSDEDMEIALSAHDT